MRLFINTTQLFFREAIKFCIPIVSSYRSSSTRKTPPRARVLINVDCSTTIRSVKVGTLNVRSLGSKSAVTLQTIVDEKLDLFAVVESWHDSVESPSVVASIPPGYQVFERARPRTGRAATSMKTNHGGICVFIRSDLYVKVVDFPSYKSFELLPLFVRIGVMSFVFIVIYRPEPCLLYTSPSPRD